MGMVLTARWGAALPVAVVVMAVAASVGGATSMADPASDTDGQPSCTFTLSAPYVVKLAGSDVVTATVKPYPCVGRTVPDKTVVCVTMTDASGPPLCVQQNTQMIPAQAYFSPYRPGATYVSTGTGCSGLYVAPFSACVSLGPKSAVL